VPSNSSSSWRDQSTKGAGMIWWMASADSRPWAEGPRTPAITSSVWKTVGVTSCFATERSSRPVGARSTTPGRQRLASGV
jgi:hypothetical protein